MRARVSALCVCHSFLFAAVSVVALPVIIAICMKCAPPSPFTPSFVPFPVSFHHDRAANPPLQVRGPAVRRAVDRLRLQGLQRVRLRHHVAAQAACGPQGAGFSSRVRAGHRLVGLQLQRQVLCAYFGAIFRVIDASCSPVALAIALVLCTALRSASFLFILLLLHAHAGGQHRVPLCPRAAVRPRRRARKKRQSPVNPYPPPPAPASRLS